MSGRSTVELNVVVNKGLNDKGTLYCDFIDLKKVVGSVNKCSLWYKPYKSHVNMAIPRRMCLLIAIGRMYMWSRIFQF
jgi:hypothetical protein